MRASWFLILIVGLSTAAAEDVYDFKANYEWKTGVTRRFRIENRHSYVLQPLDIVTREPHGIQQPLVVLQQNEVITCRQTLLPSDAPKVTVMRLDFEKSTTSSGAKIEPHRLSERSFITTENGATITHRAVDNQPLSEDDIEELDSYLNTDSSDVSNALLPPKPVMANEVWLVDGRDFLDSVIQGEIDRERVRGRSWIEKVERHGNDVVGDLVSDFKVRFNPTGLTDAGRRHLGPMDNIAEFQSRVTLDFHNGMVYGSYSKFVQPMRFPAKIGGIDVVHQQKTEIETRRTELKLERDEPLFRRS